MRGRLVEHEHGCVREQRTRKQDALALPARERRPCSPTRVSSLPGARRRTLEPRAWRSAPRISSSPASGLPIRTFSRTLVEKRWASWPASANSAPYVLLAVRAHVTAVERHAARLRVEEPQEQARHRRLARAARPDQRDPAAGREPQVNRLARAVPARSSAREHSPARSSPGRPRLHGRTGRRRAARGRSPRARGVRPRPSPPAHVLPARAAGPLRTTRARGGRASRRARGRGRRRVRGDRRGEHGDDSGAGHEQGECLGRAVRERVAARQLDDLAVERTHAPEPLVSRRTRRARVRRRTARRARSSTRRARRPGGAQRGAKATRRRPARGRRRRAGRQRAAGRRPEGTRPRPRPTPHPTRARRAAAAHRAGTGSAGRPRPPRIGPAGRPGGTRRSRRARAAPAARRRASAFERASGTRGRATTSRSA